MSGRFSARAKPAATPGAASIEELVPNWMVLPLLFEAVWSAAEAITSWVNPLPTAGGEMVSGLEDARNDNVPPPRLIVPLPSGVLPPVIRLTIRVPPLMVVLPVEVLRAEGRRDGSAWTGWRA